MGCLNGKSVKIKENKAVSQPVQAEQTVAQPQEARSQPQVATNVHRPTRPSHARNSSYNTNRREILSNEPYLDSRNIVGFNFKETDNWVGKGIKRMKGYVCPISEKELLKKRADFWGFTLK